MTRHLTLCVDDFALDDGVDRAALALASLGRLNAVSCMTAMPRWRQCSLALRDLDAAQTDVGLHLDLTQHPFDRALCGSIGGWIARAWARQIPIQRLQAEIAAQCDSFEAALGRAPTHVDGHQHVHQFPVVREALVGILTARYPVAQRPWLRSTRPPPGAGAKARVIDTLGGRALRTLAQKAGLSTNDRMLGVYEFSAPPDRYRPRLMRWLDEARDGDILVCHPGFATPRTPDPIRDARRTEVAMLCSDVFGQALAKAGIVLAPLRRHHQDRR